MKHLLLTFMTLFLSNTASAYDASFSCFNDSRGIVVVVEYDLDFPFRKPWATMTQNGRTVFSNNVTIDGRNVYGGPFHLTKEGSRSVLRYFEENMAVNCR